MAHKKEITFVEKCHLLLKAHKEGTIGNTVMPEDTNPGFSAKEREFRIAYFSLTMGLNYQRDTYSLWKAALATYNETPEVFDVKKVSKMSTATLRKKLIKHKLALQPNKHVHTWQTIARTIAKEWGSFENMIQAVDQDFLKLKQAVQVTHKKGFPYISGPKIFNYWSSILNWYGQVPLKNVEEIEMAVDTHILKCSVVLKVITEKESTELDRTEIAQRWRKALHGSGIAPTTMHFTLWFWSRNGFLLRV